VARTQIPVTQLVADTFSTITGTGTALDNTNNMYVDVTGLKSGRWFFIVQMTSTVALTVTIKAGTNPPAFRQSLGDLVLTPVANDYQVVQVGSSRYVGQLNGSPPPNVLEQFYVNPSGSNGNIWFVALDNSI